MGAGAFLFAAEKTLFELYSSCLSRLIYLRGRDVRIDQEFETLKLYPSINYFLHYKILTQNLFGVDIDPRAIKLCKQRLENSLTSAKQSKIIKNMHLPKFENIRSGNSLIGFINFNKEIFCHILDESLLERLKIFLERLSYLRDQKHTIQSKKRVEYELEEFRGLLNKKFQRYQFLLIQ